MGNNSNPFDRILWKYGNKYAPIIKKIPIINKIGKSQYKRLYLDSITLKIIRSKIPTESDFQNEWFNYWAEILGCDPLIIHRKTWEWVMITQALFERNMLKPGNTGIGFGVGKEPLSSLFASRSCKILATDIGTNTEAGNLWHETIANTINDLWESRICDIEKFKQYVSYQNVDMNHIPRELRNFDFSWSNCSFEHLGSIEHGISFIVNQMDCLKKGGWAVHATEFNLTSNVHTINDKNIVLFRRKDIESLIKLLTQKGHYVEELDTSLGSTKSDYFVDEEPYTHNPHLRLKVNEYVSTSIILVIRKG
jgi:hypothetical protein